MPGMPPLLRLPRAAVLAVLLMGSLATGCRHSNDATDPCVMPLEPGIGIPLPSVRLLVRDASGRGEALHDTVITYAGNDSVVAVGYDTLRLEAGVYGTGTFSARVKRHFYRDTLVPNLVVTAGQCGVPNVTQVPVTLTLAANAPPLRAVDIVGSTFILGPGQQNQLIARFDADASVPTTATWRLSDTTAARIDGNGLMTGKCITKARTDTVTAIATADTTVRGQALFSVATQSTCP